MKALFILFLFPFLISAQIEKLEGHWKHDSWILNSILINDEDGSMIKAVMRSKTEEPMIWFVTEEEGQLVVRDIFTEKCKIDASLIGDSFSFCRLGRFNKISEEEYNKLKSEL